MATTVLGGLLLNLMGSLTRTNWLLALSVFVVVLCLMQAGRTARHPIPPMDGHEEHSAPAPLTTRPARTDRKVFFRVATTAALVVVLFGITVAMSVISAHDTRERFTQLWLIPVHRVGGSQAELVEVGLKNFEGHATRYDLSIKRSPGAGLQHEQVTLGTNQQWTAVLTKPENQEILVTLHLATTPVQRDQFVMLPAKTEKAPLATPAQAQALPTSSSVPTARQLTMVRASP
jgi:preprotein translocase subunit SecG